MVSLLAFDIMLSYAKFHALSTTTTMWLTRQLNVDHVPMPPEAAIMVPKAISVVPHQSEPSRGNKSLW